MQMVHTDCAPPNHGSINLAIIGSSANNRNAAVKIVAGYAIESARPATSGTNGPARRESASRNLADIVKRGEKRAHPPCMQP
jgi:hypothetical protein